MIKMPGGIYWTEVGLQKKKMNSVSHDIWEELKQQMEL